MTHDDPRSVVRIVDNLGHDVTPQTHTLAGFEFVHMDVLIVPARSNSFIRHLRKTPLDFLRVARFDRA